MIDLAIAMPRKKITETNKVIHLPGLNSIRAIAALIVVIWHIDQYGNYLHFGSRGFYKTGMAASAVDIFFVLSGFLITYLLFSEKVETGKIAVKKFYWRRILRIWPLYYLALFIAVMLFGVGVIQTPKFSTAIFLYIFFLPNLAFAIPNMMIKGIIPLWSIGVEEQFYAIWPLLMARAVSGLKVIVSVIVIYLVIKGLAYFWELRNPASVVYEYIHYTRIDIMAIGALGTWIFFHKKKFLLKIIFHPCTQMAAVLVFLYSIFVHPLRIATFIDSEINALFYLIIIMNVSLNEKNWIKIDNPFFDYLGRISFGIYIYHMLLVMSFSHIYPYNTVSLPVGIMYAILILAIIAVASISYFYFEKPILAYKNKFVVVKTSN